MTELTETADIAPVEPAPAPAPAAVLPARKRSLGRPSSHGIVALRDLEEQLLQVGGRG